MTTHVHRLDGTGPSPLAHYLKALGVHRLVAEQADPRARGFWRGDVYHLVTTLDREALEAFFLTDYAPTPLVAPWNGASGFYPKDPKSGFEAIRDSAAERLARYATVIRDAEEVVGGLNERPDGERKRRMLGECRARWRGGAAQWLDAAVALTGESPRYPPLLGTGGNDGHFDFTNNFMQRLVELFDPSTGDAHPRSLGLLSGTLWRDGLGGLTRKAKFGMFAPGSAGGYNMTTGSLGKALVNPWDFVLMLEGAVAFQVAVVRRMDEGLPDSVAAPFAVHPQAGGYASAHAADESLRGEQWMPLWSAPAAWAEVSTFLREGRLRLGRQPATKALDVARAIGRLGVTRGVTGFQRFGFAERYGKSYLAVPLGRWEVGERVRGDVRLLDDIDRWVEALRRAGDHKGAPAGLGRTARRLGDAMMAVCREADGQAVTRARWTELLALLGAAEDALVSRPKATASLNLRPLPPLRPAWIDRLDPTSIEVRLAVAIASQHSPGSRDKGAKKSGLASIRANCAPLDTNRHPAVFRTDHGGLIHDPSVVWTGRDLIGDLGRLAERRLVDGRREGYAEFPLVSRLGVTLGDLDELVFGTIDASLVANLARALMAIDWKRVDTRRVSQRLRAESSPTIASPIVAVFKLLYAPHEHWFGAKQPLGAALEHLRGCHVPQDPRPLRLLLSGRVADAVAAAAHRLRAAGIPTRFESGAGDAETGRRLAAALAVPIRPIDFASAYRIVARPTASPFIEDPKSTLPTAGV